jgi:hypothetical protein
MTGKTRIGWLLIVLLFFSGCAPTGLPVVEVGPEGIISHQRTGDKTFAWDDVQALTLSGQLSSENKTYPILRIRTEEAPNTEIASSYSERVDSKSYAGAYIHLSISGADLDELKQIIIESAGLTVHPESQNTWVRQKDSKSEPPAEKKVYFKRIGS